MIRKIPQIEVEYNGLVFSSYCQFRRNFWCDVHQYVCQKQIALFTLYDRPLNGTWFSFPLPSYEKSEEHTSELQSRGHLVCRLLLEKKKISECDYTH